MPQENYENRRDSNWVGAKGHVADPGAQRGYGYGGRYGSAQDDLNLGESPASISQKNYVVPGMEGGDSPLNSRYSGDPAMLAKANDEAQRRRGVQANGSQADASLANALDSYWNQDQASFGYRNAAAGNAPSAAAVGNRMAMDNAIASQYAAGGSGANQYLAGNQGVGAMGAISAQYGGARAQEIAQAQQGGMANDAALRGNLQQQMGQSQGWAQQQAQLDAAQMARNDEMARYYTSQGNQLNLDQLTANQAYEAQKGSTALQVKQAYQASKQRDEDRWQRNNDAAVRAGLGAAMVMI